MVRSFLASVVLGLMMLVPALGVAATDGAQDFDFLIGSWKSQQHKLKKRLANNNEWTTFESELRVKKLPAGMGNIDELDMPNATGLTIRLFNPKTQLWSIYWIASNDPVMDQNPVVGRFNGFGRRVLCRRRPGGEESHRPLHLDQDRRKPGDLGPGLFARRRQELGDQLESPSSSASPRKGELQMTSVI